MLFRARTANSCLSTSRRHWTLRPDSNPPKRFPRHTQAVPVDCNCRLPLLYERLLRHQLLKFVREKCTCAGSHLPELSRRFSSPCSSSNVRTPFSAVRPSKSKL